MIAPTTEPAAPRRVLAAAMVIAVLMGGLLGPVRASAATSPTTWPQAASGVNYPVYEPTQTLNLPLTQLALYPCTVPPVPRDQVSAVYGTIKRAFFSVSEEYPEVCGNGEESRVVRKVNINGVTVGVAVICGRTRRCKVKVKNGYKNGFQLHWSQPTGTIIEMVARHISLSGVLGVARSLTVVSPQTQADR